MEYAYKERIGDPSQFVGRKAELAFFLTWIENIKKERSKSMALLARRKMGKTAILERLFNITFYKNDGVIPFYYEVQETPMWVLDFCQDFFVTFIYQYIAFKTRKIEYLNATNKSNFKKIIQIAQQEGLDHIISLIDDVELTISQKKPDILWEIVRNAPRKIAAQQNEFIVQMIDEFQLLSDKIYWDKAKKRKAHDLAGGYLGTAESKVAPLLVSGSWVGWLMDLLHNLLPSRFMLVPIGGMEEAESIEMVFKYASHFEVPVTDETAYLIAQLCEGSPFYVSSMFRSFCPARDLTTVEGVVRTLEYETLNDRGEIKATWMEYVGKALSKVNNIHAKNIVLYLCKNREREVTRLELKEDLQLDMTDADLELKLNALIKADIISQGKTAFRYQGVTDNVFDKVFRGVYQEEIETFDPTQIKKEYLQASAITLAQYRQLQGKFNYQKGYYAEYAIIDQLLYHGREKNTTLKSFTRNLPEDFNFCTYQGVWKYSGVIEFGNAVTMDILARPQLTGDYAIIGEVKNRDIKTFSLEEAMAFIEKFQWIKEAEKLDPALGFVFSRKGFTPEAEAYLQEKGIAYTQDERWLDR